MDDGQVKIKFAGEDDGLAAEAQKEVAQINAITAAREASVRVERQMQDLRKQIRQIEAEQRKATFERLPLEEQVNALLARRAELQKGLSRAQGAGSERTRLSYEAAAKLNDLRLQEKQAALGQQRKAEADRAARQKQQSDDNAALIAARAALEKRQAQEARMDALSRQRFQIARQNRDQAAASLPVEQQIAALEEKRARLARFLGRDGVSDLRRSSLQLGLQQTDAQLGGLRSGVSAQAQATLLQKRQQMESRLSETSGKLFQLARQDRQEAFNVLKPKQQLVVLEEKRERLARFIQRAGDNELRRAQLMVSLRQTENAIAATKSRQPTFVSSARDFASGQISQLVGAVTLDRTIAMVRRQIQQSVEYASKTKDLSERLATDTSTAQQFSYAAGKTNLSDDDLGTTLKALGLAQEKALGGDKDTVGMFGRFGITLQQLRATRPDELFKQIAANAEQGKTAAASLNDATKVLGKGADRVMAALRNGFSSAMDEIASSGGIIDAKTISELDDAAESFQLLSTVLTAQFAPAIAAVLDWFVGKLPLLKKWADHTNMGKIARFAGTIAGGGNLSEAWWQATEGGDAAGDEMETAIHRSKLLKEAKANAIAFQEAEVKRINEAAARESDPVRRRELMAEGRKSANNLERLRSGRDPELERQARLEELKSEVAKAQKEAAFEGLSKEEKIASLQRQKRDEAERITNNSDEEDRLQSQLKQAELDKKIAGLQKDDSDLGKIGSADALARIGIRRGGSNPVLDEAKLTRKAIERGHQRINSQLEALNNKWKDFA